MYGVWITLQAPSGRVCTVRAHDRTVAAGQPLAFATEALAADYAERRYQWYARRNTWCEVATGQL